MSDTPFIKQLLESDDPMNRFFGEHFAKFAELEKKVKVMSIKVDGMMRMFEIIAGKENE